MRSTQPWMSLFAPLPAGATPTRRSVAQPGTPGAAEGSPIAGWETVLLDLSDPPFGGRIVMVTLDEHGRANSASDHVLWRDVADPARPLAPAHIVQESLGGRIEPDGSFRGTWWRLEGDEGETDAEIAWDRESRPPTDDEVARLLNLVKALLARAPASSGP